MNPRIALRYLFTILIFIPGSIQCMSFAKHSITATLHYLPKKFQNQLTAFLFIAATILFLSKKYAWWIAGLVTVIISQVLIFDVWKVAKFVTIAKIIILVATKFSWLSLHF